MWSRVFLQTLTEPSPAALAAHLAAMHPIVPHFRGDDLGWTSGRIELADAATLELARYLTDEDDLRDDLNSHAAELESLNAPAGLLEKIIQTRQLIVLGRGDHPLTAECCRFLAQPDSIYQIDGLGWFDAHGRCLVADHLSDSGSSPTILR